MQGPGVEYPEFLQSGLKKKTPRPIELQSTHTTSGRIRGNQWSYTDFDGDGTDDLIVGVGDWTDYGWDNADAKKTDAGPMVRYTGSFTSFITRAPAKSRSMKIPSAFKQMAETLMFTECHRQFLENSWMD